MWFIETPWPPIVICLAVAVGLFFQWTYSKTRKLYLHSALGLVAISLAFFFIERVIVTEKEMVEDALIGITTAFKNDDAEKTISFIANEAENFVDGSMMKVAVLGAMASYRIEGYLRISDIHIRNGENGTMISRFRASGTIVQKSGAVGSRFSTLWEFTWKKNESDSRWQIVKIQRFSPLSEEPMETMSHNLN